MKPLPFRQEQFEEAGQVLADAFRDDPGFQYVSPESLERWRVARWSLGVSVKYAHLYGRVYTIADPIQGVAVWLTPDSMPMTFPRMVRAGMFAALYRVPPLELVRLTRMVSHTDQLRQRLLPQPHWYLMTLGIHPLHQGSGVGSLLLEHGLEEVDAAGSVCGLETENPRAIPLYERFGFKVVCESTIPKGGPSVWFLVRPAMRSGPKSR